MKKIVQFFFLLIVNSVHAQTITNITKYYHFTDTENNIIHFKVKNKSFAFASERTESDSSAILFIGNNHKIVCPKDSMFMLEVYDERFLLVSFYPIADARLASGVAYRPKDKLLIVDLDDPQKRWLYFLRNMVKTKNIDLFNSKTGELSISRKFQGKKM